MIIWKCPRCNKILFKEYALDYPYYCPTCYENFYGIEIYGVEVKTDKFSVTTKRRVKNENNYRGIQIQ